MKTSTLSYLALALPLVQAENLLWSGYGDHVGYVHAPDQVGSSSSKPVYSDDTGFLAPFDTTPPSEELFKREGGLIELAPVVNLAPGLLDEKPIPTNEWWGNLIHTSHKNEHQSTDPVWANPYAIKLPVKEAPYGVQVCYSHSYRRKAELKNDAIKFYLHEFKNDLTLSATEFTERPKYEVYDWSDVGVNLRVCTSNGANCFDSSLVHGMAFVSAAYNALTPVLTSEHKISKLDPAGDDKYIVSFEGDNKQQWVVYTPPSSGVTFKVDGSGTSIVASGPCSGTVRIAALPEGASTDVYDAYAGCVVRGGSMSMNSRTSYSLNWQVNGTSCSSTGLLHFALRHQVESMGKGESGADQATQIEMHSSTRGKMIGRVATQANEFRWTLEEPELQQPIEFYPLSKPSAEDVAKYQIKETLKEDIESEWKINKDGSYYFNGKLAQKYASLCLMASDAAVVGDDRTLLETCLTKLQGVLDTFIQNSWGHPLVYDTVYRGIITSQVLKQKDPNVDFGNGVYNDHHYHFGYWITAAAMLRKLSPDWEHMGALERVIWTLLRDVANPSEQDVYFPKFRHFSWYLGHSYSRGVMPSSDGKDQESTSEDINFHYGMMLWGKVTGRKSVEDLGSLMLRLDAHAVRTYFLMDSDNQVHPPEFVKNHVTGIFFDNKVDYTTWFSPEKQSIHGIQMIPVSPINEIVRTPKFIQEEWDDVLSKDAKVQAQDTENRWLSLLYVNYAAVNHEAAMPVLKRVAMDDGLTRSWALYIASTKSPSAVPASYEPTGAPTSTTPTSSPTMAPTGEPSVPSPSPSSAVPQSPVPTSSPSRSPSPANQNDMPQHQYARKRHFRCRRRWWK